MAYDTAGAPANSTLFYIHSDHLNTPRIATNAAQNLVWEWRSDAFGVGRTSGSLTLNLRFPGQYYDVETGLHYNYFRNYDPVIGRYLESDPIGLNGGLNTYGYVDGNPISYVDPYGLAKPGLGSGVESHNGGKDHVHWGDKSNPRKNAINKDGSIRHGKEPPQQIKDKINKKFNWDLKIPFMLIPFSPELLKQINPHRPPDPMDGIPREC